MHQLAGWRLGAMSNMLSANDAMTSRQIAAKQRQALIVNVSNLYLTGFSAYTSGILNHVFLSHNTEGLWRTTLKCTRYRRLHLAVYKSLWRAVNTLDVRYRVEFCDMASVGESCDVVNSDNRLGIASWLQISQVQTCRCVWQWSVNDSRKSLETYLLDGRHVDEEGAERSLEQQRPVENRVPKSEK